MKNNRLLSFLLALAVSIGLWLYVVTIVDPNDTKTVYGVPVTLTNMEYLEENNLTITSGEGSTVTLKFYGRRSELNDLTSSSITVAVDLSKIKNEGEQSLNYTITLQDSVSANDVEITDRNPGRLTMTVERAVDKEVPVEIDIINEVAEGYMADLENMTIMPERLTIFGPAQDVEAVEVARVTLDISQVTETLDSSYPYKLLDAEGNEVLSTDLQVSHEAIELNLPVRKYKEIPLQLNVEEGGGATEDNVQIDLTPKYITIAGPAAVVDEMDSLVIGTLDLASLTANKTTLSYAVTMPTGVTNISGEIQVSAQIILEDLDQKTMDVEQFTLHNEPEGMSVSVKTTVLQITLRGPVEAIDAVEPEDLTVAVDLTPFKQAGTYSIPVTVSSRTYPDVGMVGSASITVNIS